MSLKNRLVAISISNAPDLNRLGYPQREVDRVLLSVCTALVRAGARIVYGGNLDPAGFTFKIFRHLAEAYAVRGPEAPFVHIVPEPVLRRVNFDDFTSMLREARGIVETNIAFANERVIALKAQDGEVRVLAAGPSPEAGINIQSQEALRDWLGPQDAKPSDAYSATRRAMARMTVGRVVMGGKMGLKAQPNDRYEGAMPGVIQEAMMTLAGGQALLTLGAFGGAARDLAIALKLLQPSMRVPRGPQEPSYHSALEQVGMLADRIPEPLRGELSQIARDDRAEPLGFAIVRILEKWQGEGLATPHLTG
jgi:hypothetical protein